MRKHLRHFEGCIGSDMPLLFFFGWGRPSFLIGIRLRLKELTCEGGGGSGWVGLQPGVWVWGSGPPPPLIISRVSRVGLLPHLLSLFT